MPPRKPKVSNTEAQEAVNITKKIISITGGKNCSTPGQVEAVHAVLQDFLKSKKPTIHF